MAGITIYTSEPFGWSDTLPPYYEHYGPKPFLSDGRSPQFMDILPSSQKYREYIFQLLKLAREPGSISPDTAKDYKPDGSDFPKPGVFSRAIERSSNPRHLTPPASLPTKSALTTGNPAPGRTNLFPCSPPFSHGNATPTFLPSLCYTPHTVVSKYSALHSVTTLCLCTFL